MNTVNEVTFYSQHKNLWVNFPPEVFGYGFSVDGETQAPLPDAKFENHYFKAPTRKIRRKVGGEVKKDMSLADMMRRHQGYGKRFEEQEEVDMEYIARLESAITARIPDDFNQNDQDDVMALVRHIKHTMRDKDKAHDALIRVVKRFKISNVKLFGSPEEYPEGIEGFRRKITFVLGILDEQGILVKDNIINIPNAEKVKPDNGDQEPVGDTEKLEA